MLTDANDFFVSSCKFSIFPMDTSAKTYHLFKLFPWETKRNCIKWEKIYNEVKKLTTQKRKRKNTLNNICSNKTHIYKYWVNVSKLSHILQRKESHSRNARSISPCFTVYHNKPIPMQVKFSDQLKHNIHTKKKKEKKQDDKQYER